MRYKKLNNKNIRTRIICLRKKIFFPKYYSRTSLSTSIKIGCYTHFPDLWRFLLPFPLKYQILETPQNTGLRLKTLINNNFLLNGFQILPWIKQTTELPRQRLELWRLLLPLKVYILDYLKFNSEIIRIVVKSLKCSNFLINSTQAVI